MKKRIISMLLMLVLSFGCLSMIAVAESELRHGDFYYEIVDGEAVITDFDDESEATSVIIPAVIDEYPVTQIGESAFYECGNIETVVIPEGVKIIGFSAFDECTSLKSVTIPSTITFIENTAFWSCENLKTVNITDLSAWCNIEFEWHSANPLYNGADLYLNGNKVTELVIPADVTAVKNCAFVGAAGITSVTIPATVESVGEYAFELCSNISTLKIENGVKTISDYAFAECVSLTTAEIPDSVTELGGCVFYLCEKLASAKLPKGFSARNDGMFFGCKGLADKDGFVIYGDVLYGYFGTNPAVAIPDTVKLSEQAVFMSAKTLRLS